MRIAAYCRVSTDKEDQLNSFESQKSYFKDYINCKSDWNLYNIYADEGISGTSTKKRDSFNKMINDAYLGRFDKIVTKEVSRFSRNILDTISFTRDLRRLGVEVIFMNDGINTFEPDSELRLSIMGSIAQEESRKTSSRVKWGQTRRMEQGIVFGRSMLGYDVKNGKMSINTNGAKIVRLIFHKYINEYKGTAIIARELTEEGYKTFTGNTKWSNGVILKILKNEKYCGDLCQKKTYTPDYLTHEKKYNYNAEEKIFIYNHHEPIIKRELWDMVQKEIARRNINTNDKKGHGNRYPLSGKIKCGNCGSSFVARYKKRSDGSKYKCWRCSTATTYGKKKINKSGIEIGCDIGRQLRDDVAIEIVKKSVDSLSIDKEAIIQNIVGIVTEVIYENNYSEKLDIKKLEKQLNLIVEKKKSVLDEFFTKNISKDEMKMMNEKYDTEIIELSEKINFIMKKQNYSYSKYDIKKDVEEKVSDIVNGKVLTDNFYRKLLNEITVLPDKSLCVKFNFLPTQWYYTI